jgi:putative ABC transport system permease protein
LRANALAGNASQTLVIRNGTFDDELSYDALAQRLRQVPGVESVAAIDNVPWGPSTNTGAIARSVAAEASFISPLVHTVTPGFEESLGLRLLAGRSFDQAYGDDFLPGGYPMGLQQLDTSRTYNVVIDAALAASLGWQDPAAAIDQVAYMPFSKIGMKDMTVRVIGVVEHRPLRMIASGSTSNLFLSTRNIVGYPLVRIATANVPATLSELEKVWQTLVPQSPLQMRFLDEYFERSYRLFAQVSDVITGVTLFAFVISMMGLIGMAIFIVSRRRHEMGVRKTLGASARQILMLLLRDFARPIAIANVAVWPLAWIAANAYLDVFTHRMALTPVPFIASLVVTIAIAWLAVGGQAWRAARVKPADVLRYE